MSFFDSALDVVSSITKAIPALNAFTPVVDAVKSLWNTVQPLISDTAQSAANQYTNDWPQAQQDWVNRAIDTVFG